MPEHLRYKKTTCIFVVVHFCTGGVGKTALGYINFNGQQA
jgi:hypothetical protein